MVNLGTATTYELENVRRSLTASAPDTPAPISVGDLGQLLRRVISDETELQRLRDPAS
jgi:hypothetical protein